jgi:hypothetical protein
MNVPRRTAADHENYFTVFTHAWRRMSVPDVRTGVSNSTAEKNPIRAELIKSARSNKFGTFALPV